MCMNCGCDEPDKRHQPTDIVREDVQRAADGSGMSFTETARHLERSSARLASGEQPVVSGTSRPNGTSQN